VSLVVPRNGEGDGLKYFVNQAQPENLILRLFVNDVTPSETDTAANYVEASGAGYAPKLLRGGEWNVAEGAPSEAAYPMQQFDFLAPLGNIYGYFLTRERSGRIAAAERDPAAPFNVASAADVYRVAPRITLD
jgi:hypothetical protein